MIKKIKHFLVELGITLSKEKGVSHRDIDANTEIINEKKEHQEMIGLSMMSLNDAKRFVESYKAGTFEADVDKWREEALAIESDEAKRNTKAQCRAIFLTSLEDREKDMALWNGKTAGPMDSGVDPDDVGMDELKDIFAKHEPYQPESPLNNAIKRMQKEAVGSVSKSICKPEKNEHTVKVGNVDVVVPIADHELEKKVGDWFTDSLHDAHDHDGVPCSFTCATHVSLSNSLSNEVCPDCGKAWPCKNISRDGTWIGDDKPIEVSEEDKKLKDMIT